MIRPTSTADLLPSERQIMAAMSQLGFGRLEFLRIKCGELILHPWPSTVRDVKFGAAHPTSPIEPSMEFGLKKQLVEFFEYVRSVKNGEILTLHVRGGLPFMMQVAYRKHPDGGTVDA